MYKIIELNMFLIPIKYPLLNLVCKKRLSVGYKPL